MATDAPMATATDAAFLTVLQWVSPLFPVGGFAYSHGLEAAVEAGKVADAADLEAWLEDVLRFGGGHADALFLAAAYKAPDLAALRRIDALCRAFAPSHERLMETDLQGAAFGQVAQEVWRAGAGACTFPVAVGHAARAEALPLEMVGPAFLHAFAANLVSAALRLMPLGQTAGQRVLRTLAPVIRAVAQDTAHGDPDRLSGTAFLVDIASMHHETQRSRIFRT